MITRKDNDGILPVFEIFTPRAVSDTDAGFLRMAVKLYGSGILEVGQTATWREFALKLPESAEATKKLVPVILDEVKPQTYDLHSQEPGEFKEVAGC